MGNRKYNRLVDARHWQNMDGETDLLKKLNSYITCQFILETDIPADECLMEAIHIAEHTEWTRIEIEDYLIKQFMMPGIIRRGASQQAEGVVKIFEEHGISIN